MTRAVLPLLAPEGRRLVTGERVDEGDRLPPLEDDDGVPDDGSTWAPPPPPHAAVGGA